MKGYFSFILLVQLFPPLIPTSICRACIRRVFKSFIDGNFSRMCARTWCICVKDSPLFAEPEWDLLFFVYTVEAHMRTKTWLQNPYSPIYKHKYNPIHINWVHFHHSTKTSHFDRPPDPDPQRCYSIEFRMGLKQIQLKSNGGPKRYSPPHWRNQKELKQQKKNVIRRNLDWIHISDATPPPSNPFRCLLDATGSWISEPY